MAEHSPLVDPRRVGFFGGSQGGGSGLLLASILQSEAATSRLRVVAVASDQPFMTNYPLMVSAGDLVHPAPAELASLVGGGATALQGAALASAWAALGHVDTIAHAHRLRMPVLLTAGDEDGTCPLPAIESLFERLPGVRSLLVQPDTGHAGTDAFAALSQAWMLAHCRSDHEDS